MPYAFPQVAPIAGTWRLHLKRGYAALRAGHGERAANAFEQALGVAPDHPSVLRAVGRLRLDQGRPEEAAQLLRRGLELQPTSVVAAATLARVLGLHLDRLDEAVALVNSAFRASDALVLEIVRGELALEAGDLPTARAAFDSVLARREGHRAARTGLARTYNLEGINLSNAGELQRAAFAFKRAADLDPAWSAPCVNMGVVLGRLGKPSKAIAAYHAALRRDPHNPVAYYNMGSAHHELGELPKAVQAVETLLSICPRYPQARLALANTLIDQGEHDRAIALLLEEIDGDGASVQVWSSLGLAHICSGNADRGEQCLQRALALDPKHFNAYYNLAVLYATQKRDIEANEVLGRAFEVDPQRASQLRGKDLLGLETLQTEDRT